MTAQDASLSLAIEQLDSIFAPAGPSASPSEAVKQKRAQKREALSVSTPALMSLLPASKKRKLALAEAANVASGFAETPSSNSKAYRPQSLDDLLDRLASYTLVLWNDGKPSSCSTVAFARHGWRATGKRREQIQCDMCDQTWEIPRYDDWTSDEGRRAREEVEKQISSRHARSCPWRDRPCPSNLYQLPLAMPSSKLLQDIFTRAAGFTHIEQLDVVHPLKEGQLQQLRSATLAYQARSSQECSPRENSAICGLFGWQVMPVSSPASASTVLQCRYCTRRVLLKAQVNATQARPSIDVRASHRRFCAYVNPVSDEDARQGWTALLEAVLDGQKPGGRTVAGQTDTTSSDQPLQSIQTKETLIMVKELLQGGRTVRRKAF